MKKTLGLAYCLCLMIWWSQPSHACGVNWPDGGVHPTLQSALNATPAGDCTYVAAGTYIIDAFLRIPPNVGLYGAGPGQTTLQANSAFSSSGSGANRFSNQFRQGSPDPKPA